MNGPNFKLKRYYFCVSGLGEEAGDWGPSLNCSCSGIRVDYSREVHSVPGARRLNRPLEAGKVATKILNGFERCAWFFRSTQYHQYSWKIKMNFPDFLPKRSNLRWMPNSDIKGFDTAMKTGSSIQVKRYPTTYMWVSSWFPFTMD